MKIERTNRPTAKPVCEIKAGDVFELNGRAYMVLSSTEFTGGVGRTMIYSANLEAGTILNLPEDALVAPRPDAKVVL